MTKRQNETTGRMAVEGMRTSNSEYLRQQVGLLARGRRWAAKCGLPEQVGLDAAEATPLRMLTEVAKGQSRCEKPSSFFAWGCFLDEFNERAKSARREQAVLDAAQLDGEHATLGDSFSEDAGLWPRNGISPSARLEAADDEMTVQRFIAGLPDLDRICIRLAMCGWRLERIGAALGIAASTVQRRLRRLRVPLALYLLAAGNDSLFWFLRTR